MTQDRRFMEAALEQARACRAQGAEDSLRSHPNVGVVLIRPNEPPLEAFRGQRTPGEHAEFTATERILPPTASIAGATLYTTLEPCTARRHPKIACADRLVQRKLAEVVIGMLDPNPVITGKGLLLLREKGVRIRLFDPDLMEQVEDLNRDFRLQFRPLQPISATDAAARSLDQWYQAINSIYSRNFTQDVTAIFTHLVEIVGGLGTVAADKVSPRVNLEDHIPKALAWWMALCGRVGVRSLSDMLWAKFPAVCPYCVQPQHKQVLCDQRKEKALLENRPAVDWSALTELGVRAARNKPQTLAEWQRLFATIYEPKDPKHAIAKLGEELGELAEAIRALRITPAYFLNEAADVFAWLMHLQTVIDARALVSPDKLGNPLTERFAAAYPDRCSHCQNQICVCQPILGSTLGRIGHERRIDGNEMMTSQDTLRVFGLGIG